MYYVLGAVALIALYTIIVYNSLVQLRNRVDNGWAQIDVQLQRRWDLIPKVAEIATSYLSHEHETLLALTQARTQAAAAGADPAARAEAEGQLGTVFRQLFAVAEAYPDLKGNTVMIEAQRELSETESKIGFARQFYNDTVMMFNTKIATFPANIIAGMFGFRDRKYFELASAEHREMPDVSFSTGRTRPGA